MPQVDPAIYQHPQFRPDRSLKSSDELLDIVRQLVGNRLLLGMSGKDSLAAWLYLRENGFEIIPYMLYYVPLSIDVEAWQYYQDFFGQKIYFLPHPLFYDDLRNYAFQLPDIAGRIEKMGLPEFNFAVIENAIAAENGLANYLSVIGYRRYDNAGRRSFMERNGVIGQKERKYYFAIYDWKTEQVIRFIRRYNVKVPYHYHVWGNTGTGRPFEYLGLLEMEKYIPEDLERVKVFFPLIEIEKFRYEVVNKWAQKLRENRLD